MTDRTLAIIKPDAVKRNLIGKIISLIEDNDFVINRTLTQTSRLESVFYALTKYFGQLPEAVELSEVERF